MSRSCVKQDDSNMKGGEVMNCKDVAELLPLFLDTELEPDIVAEVGVHLATCSTCQQLLQDYRREQQILQSLPLVAPSPTWRAELLDKVSNNRRRDKQPAWRFFVPRLGSLAAALLVVLLVSNLYVFPSYVAKGRPDDDMQRMAVLTGPRGINPGQSETSGGPEATMEADPPEETYAAQSATDGDPEAIMEADPPEEIGIMGFTGKAKTTADAVDTNITLMQLAAPPANDLQRRWWLWSSGLSIVIWLAGAGYYYYRYRRRLRELTE